MSSSAQDITSPGPPRVQEVSDGIYAYLQPDGTWWINNTGFLAGRHGVVSIDACATRWPVPTNVISTSMVTADTTTFPPTLICHYAEAPGAAPTITVDQFPTGPEVFYTSLGALAVAAFLGLVLLARFHRQERAPAVLAETRRQ